MNAFLKLARVFSRSTAPAGPFIGLREQRFLSDREFHRACKIIDWIQSVMETRTPYIDRHRLKSDIHDPQAIWKFWEGRPMYGAFRLVCSKDRHVINYLRMWTQHFTGYRLFTMERSEGKGFPDPGEIGPASDTRYALIAERPDDYVFKYRTLCQRLPRELHISPPSRFGEVGWNEGGRIVNHDTYAYQERIALLHASGGIDHLQGILATGRAPRVLEIGGGYGALAYH